MMMTTLAKVKKNLKEDCKAIGSELWWSSNQLLQSFDYFVHGIVLSPEFINENLISAKRKLDVLKKHNPNHYLMGH